MALSKQEIQAKSDAKRGVKLASFKLHQDIIALLNELSQQTGKSKTAIVSEAVKQFAQQTQ